MTPHERAVKGGKARARQFTRESQQAARARLPHEVVVRAGRNGFRAAISRGLSHKALEGTSKWRQEHPSKEEQEVAGLLLLHKFEFAREVVIPTDDDNWLVDFLVNGDIVEVNGRAHSSEICDPVHKAQVQARKFAALAGRGYRVLVLKYEDRDAWENQLTEFLQPAVQPEQLTFIPF